MGGSLGDGVGEGGFETRPYEWNKCWASNVTGGGVGEGGFETRPYEWNKGPAGKITSFGKWRRSHD